MKIVLLYPPNPDLTNKDFKMMGTIPHLGLLSIGGVLQKDGHMCEYLDAFNYRFSIQETIQKILKATPDLVAITSNSPNYPSAVAIAKRIRKKKIPVVIGGMHATSMPMEVLDSDSFDYVVMCEGEFPLQKLARSLEHKTSIDHIEGLMYKKDDGTIHSVPEKIIPDLSVLPPRAWNLVDLTKYKPSPAAHKHTPAISTMMSRGCPYSCIFCSLPSMFKRNPRRYSLEYLEEELKLFKEQGIRDINFFDSIFTYNRNWAIHASKIIKKYNFIWNCIGRVDQVDKELLEIMHAAGCYQIGYGIESGDQKTLDLIGKGVKVEHVEKIMKLHKKIGMQTKCYFIIGFPWEMKNDIKNTIRFAFKMRPEIAAFSIAIPFPGSKWFEQYKHMYNDIKKYKGLHNYYSIHSISQHISPKELQKMRDRAHFTYYINPRYFIMMLKQIKSWEDLKYYATTFSQLFLTQ